MTDTYRIGTSEYTKLYNYLFNNYFPTYTIEVVDSNNYATVYKVNNLHRVMVVHNSEITIERCYYL